MWAGDVYVNCQGKEEDGEVEEQEEKEKGGEEEL